MKIIELEECASTNTEAWKYSADHASMLVLARRQSAGRGRQGRQWMSQASGNLYVSLLCFPEFSVLNWIPLAAGVAVMQAFIRCCEQSGLALSPRQLEAVESKLRLKWPNDIYIENAKAGGILCESRLSGDSCTGVVVGMGLNLVEAPQIPETPTASFLQNLLSDMGYQPELSSEFPRKIAESWGKMLLDRISELQEIGSETTRLDWLKWAKLDRYSALRVHNRQAQYIDAQALDLDASGKLKAVIRLPSGAQETVFLDQAEALP